MSDTKEGYSANEWAIAVVVGVLLFVGLKACTSGDEAPKASTEPRAVVSNSDWDASVHQVKDYIRANAKDASSIEYLEWSPVRRESDGTFLVRVKYRAKNSFGAFVVENTVFRLSNKGRVLSAQ